MNTSSPLRPRIRHCLGGVVLLVFAAALGACGGEESPQGPASSAVPTAARPDTMTLDRLLRTDGRFSSLVRALDSTGFDSTLAAPGPLTLFAPPDTAFAVLPAGTLPILLTDRRERLRTILSHHVVEGRIEREALADASPLTTLSGDTLRVRRTDSTLRVGNARVLDGDVPTANGLVHVIDAVLRPPAPDEAPTEPTPD